MGEGDDEGGGSDGGDNVYNGKVEPVLVSLSNSYSDDKAISVSDSRYSSYPAYTDTDYFYQPTTALMEMYTILA